MIGQMVTEIASEAKAGHFAGLVPVILPLLDGGSSHRNGTTGDPNESPHPVVNRTLHRCMHAYMRISCRAGRASLLLIKYESFRGASMDSADSADDADIGNAEMTELVRVAHS